MTDPAHGIAITRVPISLPCQVPVHPGTGNCEGPVEQRTEACATDAWWMVGRALICDEHLRHMLGDTEYDATCGDVPLNDSERLPWSERHRYAQDQVGAL